MKPTWSENQWLPLHGLFCDWTCGSWDEQVLGSTSPLSPFPPNEAIFIHVTQKKEMKQNWKEADQTLSYHTFFDVDQTLLSNYLCNLCNSMFQTLKLPWKRNRHFRKPAFVWRWSRDLFFLCSFNCQQSSGITQEMSFTAQSLRYMQGYITL